MKLLLALLCSCVSLPHVDPTTRSPSQWRRATVAIHTECLEDEPVRAGTGVVMTERHILTAYHVVSCPLLPTVHVSLANGREVRANVLREDSDHDLALLEISSADNFELGVPPPILAVPSVQDIAAAQWCAQSLNNEEHCGTVTSLDIRSATFSARTHPGDSGSGVYDEQGALVGIVNAGGRFETKVARINFGMLP